MKKKKQMCPKIERGTEKEKNMCQKHVDEAELPQLWDSQNIQKGYLPTRICGTGAGPKRAKPTTKIEASRGTP